jgi:hypothetical protein
MRPSNLNLPEVIATFHLSPVMQKSLQEQESCICDPREKKYELPRANFNSSSCSDCSLVSPCSHTLAPLLGCLKVSEEVVLPTNLHFTVASACECPLPYTLSLNR